MLYSMPVPTPEDKGKMIDATLITIPVPGYEGQNVQFTMPLPGYQGESIQIGDILQNILEQGEGTVPLTEHAELPAMGDGTTIRVQLINGSLVLMNENPMPGQVFWDCLLQQEDQSTIRSLDETLVLPEEDLSAVHRTRQQLPHQVERNTIEQKPTQSESYICLRVQVEDGWMSIVDWQEVEGPLIQPEEIHAEFVYEVTMGEKRIGIDSFSNPMIWRSYSNPDDPEQQGHFFGSSPRYGFKVSIPRNELSLSDLPKVQIVLYQVVSGDVLDQPLGSKLLADQFGHEIKEVARLNEI